MSGKIKFGITFENLAEQIKPYLPDAGVPLQTYNVSAYPVWWDKTITVYNRYENPVSQLVTWYRHVISNCFIKTSATMITGGQVTYDTSTNIIRIPQQNNYMSYDEWVDVPNVEQGNYVTLHQGDIIVFKQVNDRIDEYTSGLRSSDLLDTYNRLNLCLIINSCQDNTGNGRACPHYFVSGE